MVRLTNKTHLRGEIANDKYSKRLSTTIYAIHNRNTVSKAEKRELEFDHNAKGH